MSTTRQCINTSRLYDLCIAYSHAMSIDIIRKPACPCTEVFTQRLHIGANGSSVPISRGGPPPSSR